MKGTEQALGDALAYSENAETWRKLCTLLLIELAVFALSLVYNHIQFGTVTWWVPADGFVVAACLVVLLWSGPKRIFLTELALAVSSTAVLTCVLLTSQRKMEAGIPGNMFEGNKLFIMAIAVLGFRNWKISATLLGLATVIPIAQFYSWSPAWREQVFGAAFSVASYAIIGGVYSVYGFRTQQTLHRLLQRDLETRELRRFARVMLSAKDLANTPLQVLRGSIILLRRDPTRSEEHLARMDRACSRLTELNEIFARYEASIDLGKAEALDSSKTLEEIAQDWDRTRLI